MALRTRICAVKAAVKKINGMSMRDRSSRRIAASRRGKATTALLLLLGAGFTVSVLVFYPGYITVDARYVYAEAKAWHFGDWQSPAMGVLWRLIDLLAPGSVGMFLLTVTLYWLSFGTLGFIALRRSNWLALATPLLAFSPPAFFFIGLIWRDILFGVVWLFAAVLVFAVAERQGALRFIAQSLALFLVAFGVLLRPNAVIAAPLLAIYAIWPTRFRLTRLAIGFLPAVVVFCGLVPAVYYGLLGAERQNPLHSIVVFDLGGVTHFSRRKSVPGAVERGAEGSAGNQVLRPRALGHVLARAALRIRNATARARRRSNFRPAATRAGMVGCGDRPPVVVPGAPRNIYVAIPGALKSRAAGMGLG